MEEPISYLILNILFILGALKIFDIALKEKEDKEEDIF